MASIAYPTSLNTPGPWLLDAKSLHDLDDLVASCFVTMREHLQREVESEVAERKRELLAEGRSEQSIEKQDLRSSILARWKYKPENRGVTIYLSGGKTAEGMNFKELMHLTPLHDEVPRGFLVRAAVGTASLRVSLKLGSFVDRDFSIEVSAEDNEIGMELFGKLQNWATDIQPKRWLQMWLKAGWLISLTVGALWLVMLLFAVGAMSSTEPGPSLVKQQARALASQGVNSANEAKALQLLLAIESGYEPEPISPVHRAPSTRFWVYMCIFLAIAIGIALAPTGAIGIWGGRRTLERQRLWARVASVTIPGLVASNFLVPWLTHWLSSL